MSFSLQDQVRAEIAGQFRAAVAEGREAFDDASGDEDSITGALIAPMGRLVKGSIAVGGQQFFWSTHLKKLRGRGPGAPEKRIGADAIFEIEVRTVGTTPTMRKALLMQSKTGWTGKDSRLKGQCVQMEAAAPGLGIAVDFTAAAYTGVAAATVVQSDGNRRSVPAAAAKDLGTMLGSDFLECRIGTEGVYYDAVRELLVVGPTVTPARVKNRVRTIVTQVP